ncbi:hypothetical protein MRX50_19210, partial [Fusibacter sp. A2]|nr:hypothetical protein [Fusibacter sp. A2]
MQRKKSGGALSRFFIGILGGVLGAALVGGGFYLANGSNLQPSNTTEQTTTASGETKVSNVKVNADTDITSAVEKVQDAVVSVINLQKQQASSDNPFGDLFGQGQSESESESDSESGGLQAVGEGSGVIYKKDGKTAYV